VASTPDGCVVLTAPLAARVERFLARYLVEHPPVAGQFGCEGEVEPIPGVAWLSEASGVPAGTILNMLTRKNGELAPRYATTHLRIADALATVLGFVDDLLDGGDLEPFPNPNAPLFHKKTGERIRGGADGRCGCSGSTSEPTPIAASVAAA
jgi:hypothetical protein